MATSCQFKAMAENCGNRSRVGRPKGVGYRLSPTLSDCVGNNSKWALSCFTSRSKSPSILPAQNSVFQNQRAAQQAIIPADVNFTPILQGQSRSRTVKNRETPVRKVSAVMRVGGVQENRAATTATVSFFILSRTTAPPAPESQSSCPLPVREPIRRHKQVQSEPKCRAAASGGESCPALRLQPTPV